MVQATKIGARPALAYRADFRPWRVRLPISVLRDPCGPANPGDWLHDWTAEVRLEAFAAAVREAYSASVLQKAQPPITMLV